MSWSEVIKHIMYKKDVSQKWIAETIGCNAGYLSLIKSGKMTNPQKRIATALIDLYKSTGAKFNEKDLVINPKVSARKKYDLLNIGIGKSITYKDANLLSLASVVCRLRKKGHTGIKFKFDAKNKNGNIADVKVTRIK